MCLKFRDKSQQLFLCHHCHLTLRFRDKDCIWISGLVGQLRNKCDVWRILTAHKNSHCSFYMESWSWLADWWCGRSIPEHTRMQDSVNMGHIDLLTHRMHNQHCIRSHLNRLDHKPRAPDAVDHKSFDIGGMTLFLRLFHSHLEDHYACILNHVNSNHMQTDPNVVPIQKRLNEL